MPTYCVQDDSGYVGILEHPVPNLEPGDMVTLDDGREALVTARVEGRRGSRFVAVLDVAIAPEPEPDSR